MIFLSGKVTYVVEGVTYFLKPWDIVLIQHNLIHRPIIHAEEPYERAVLWLGRDWIAQRSDPGEPLDACLDKSREQGFHLLRTGEEGRLGYARFIQQLEEALRSEEFGARPHGGYAVPAAFDSGKPGLPPGQYRSGRDGQLPSGPQNGGDPPLYRRQSGGRPLRGRLGGRFYMSRYYLMHRFKEITGYTVHQYTVQKRLLRAGELIREGVPVMKAAEQAGFPEYSTFLRAFQNTFHTSPKNFR